MRRRSYQVKGEGLEQGTVFQIGERHEKMFCRRANHGLMMGTKTPVGLGVGERRAEGGRGCERPHLGHTGAQDTNLTLGAGDRV